MSTTDNPSPQAYEKARLNGCMIVMIVLTIILLGLLGWFLLWERAIPEGEDASDPAKREISLVVIKQHNPV